ncbi:MAG: hypothetical protein QXZ11_03245 [Thermoproteota archaeon]
MPQPVLYVVEREGDDVIPIFMNGEVFLLRREGLHQKKIVSLIKRIRRLDILGQALGDLLIEGKLNLSFDDVDATSLAIKAVHNTDVIANRAFNPKRIRFKRFRWP